MQLVRGGETIGVGVITFNRPELFGLCIGSIPDVDTLVIVNDGTPYDDTVYPSRVSRLIQHHRPKGVAASKNDALRSLLEAGCRHLFLIEDDVRIVDPGICEAYIRAANATGILHFNFGYHGPMNKRPNGTPDPRQTLKVEDGTVVCFNRHLVGAFSYYRSDVLESVGLLDEGFRNSLDHVEHTYRIIQQGFHPPFRWFADLDESWRAIEDLDPDLSQSVLKNGWWQRSVRFRWSELRFRVKHGFFLHRLPDPEWPAVEAVLKSLKTGLPGFISPDSARAQTRERS